LTDRKSVNRSAFVNYCSLPSAHFDIFPHPSHSVGRNNCNVDRNKIKITNKITNDKLKTSGSCLELNAKIFSHDKTNANVNINSIYCIIIKHLHASLWIL